jgi:ribosome silencing factor RsfS/YbeB/iojap
VIGAGYWGPNIVRNLYEAPGAEAVAVADLSQDRLDAISKRFPALRVTTDYREVIGDPSIDAICVVTPVGTHRKLAEEAFAAGKHVFVEKPLAKTVSDAEAIVRAGERAGKTLDGLVPPGVARYIETHRLYRQHEPQEDPSPVTEPANDPPTAAAATSTIPRLDGLPSRGPTAPTDERPLDMARRIVELAEDKKAADIVLLDLTGLTTLADAFVICSGGSERQLDAIADGILEGLRAEKIRPIGREGTAASHWVLVDFGSVVVHIFTPPERDYYSLEKHWAEARTVLRVQ